MERPRVATEDLIPVKTVSTRYGDIHFYCAGRVCLYRADTFHTKEPETLEWIDTFQPGDVLWDIGANVGCYSLYAARRSIKVMAFEPSAFNYFMLMKNVHLNGFDDTISALCLPFSNTNALASFNMNYLEVGDSCHTLTPYQDGSPAQLKQATLTLTIDDFVGNFAPPFPTHVKIDVDGVEAQIIQGGMKTFTDPRLRTILIEIDDSNPKDANIVRNLESIGLRIASKRHAPQYDGTSVWNCVFTKN